MNALDFGNNLLIKANPKVTIRFSIKKKTRLHVNLILTDNFSLYKSRAFIDNLKIDVIFPKNNKTPR